LIFVKTPWAILKKASWEIFGRPPKQKPAPERAPAEAEPKVSA
jgi:hypothetical protein